MSANDQRLIERAQELAQRIAELRAAYQFVSFGEDHEEITTYPRWSKVAVPLKAVYEFAIKTQSMSPQTSDDNTTKWSRLVAEQATLAYQSGTHKGKIDGLVDNYVLGLFALEDGGKPNLDFQEPENRPDDPETAINRLVNVLRPRFDLLSLKYQETPLSLTIVEHTDELSTSHAINLIPDWYGWFPRQTVQQTHPAEMLWLATRTHYRPAYRDPNEGPWRAYYFTTENLAARAAFSTCAEEAALCLSDWATQFGVAANTLTVTDALTKWNFALFDLAWNFGGPSFPIDTKRAFLQREAIVEVRARLNNANTQNKSQIEDRIAALEGQGFCAHIKDVLRASIYAIDVLFEQASKCAETVAEPPVEPSKAESDLPSLKAQSLSDKKDCFVFCMEDDGYFIQAFGVGGHFRRLVGSSHVYKLVQRPGIPIAMADLVTNVDSHERSDAPRNDELNERSEWSRQSILDDQALREYFDQLNSLKTDLERANAVNNNVDADIAQREITKIQELLKGARGLGGQPRPMNQTIDKLRPRIHGALKTFYRQLREASVSMSKLADHFDATIMSESGEFIYRPDPKTISWSIYPLSKK